MNFVAGSRNRGKYNIKGKPCCPTVNKIACLRIVRWYNEDGRPFAACDLLKGGEPSVTEVVFNITEGPRVKLRDIRFTGNTFVSATVLEKRITRSRERRTLLVPTNADNAAEEIVKYYRSFDYHGVEVEQVLVFLAEGYEASLVFHIVEGSQFRPRDTPPVSGVPPYGSLPILPVTINYEVEEKPAGSADPAKIETKPR